MSQEKNQSKSQSQAPPIPPDPSASKKGNPKLEHWAVISEEGEDMAAVDFKYQLQGEIHGHPNPRFTDGQAITTSTLVALDVAGRTARTKNTVYDLGEPDPTFVDYVKGLKIALESYSFVHEPNLRKRPRSL